MNEMMRSMPRGMQYDVRGTHEVHGVRDDQHHDRQYDDRRYGEYDGHDKHGQHKDRTMEDLKWLKNNMRGNIEEAKGFAMKANEMRDKNPAIADLCKVMMRGHLQFEEEGDDVMRKLVDQYKHENMEDPMAPGYAYALEDERKDLRKEAEKVRQLVEPGK